MNAKKRFGVGVTAVLGAALLVVPIRSTEAVSPTPRTLYQLPGNAQCTKGFGNCVAVPKAAALPSGRLVAAFEKATVGPSGTAVGQVIPVYRSDDDGTTWQWLSDVRAPAYLSSNPAYAK